MAVRRAGARAVAVLVLATAWARAQEAEVALQPPRVPLEVVVGEDRHRPTRRLRLGPDRPGASLPATAPWTLVARAEDDAQVEAVCRWARTAGATRLDLSLEALTETAAGHLGSLRGLTRLWLYHRTVPAKSLDGLAGLAALEDVEWSSWSSEEAAARALPDLPALPALRRLVLQTPGLLGPKTLAKLTALRSLEAMVHEGGVDWVAALDGHPALEEVRLSTRAPLGPAVARLGPLPRLRKADLSCDEGLDDAALAALGRQPALEELEVAGPALTDAAVEALAKAPRLAKLRLGGPIGDAGAAALAKAPALVELGLGGSERLTDAGLAALAGSKTLRGLAVSGCPKVEGPGLAAASARLEVLEVSSCPELGPPALGALGAGLRTLRLFDCPGLGPAAFAKLPAGLEELSVVDAPLGDEGLKAAAAVARGLKRLALGGAGLTDAGLAPLAKLPALEELRLSGPGLGEGAFAAVGGLASLRRLTTQGLPFSDAALARLSGLAKLELLELRAEPGADAPPPTPVGLAALRGLERLERVVLGTLPRPLETIRGLRRLDALRAAAAKVELPGEQTLVAVRGLGDARDRPPAVTLTVRLVRGPGGEVELGVVSESERGTTTLGAHLGPRLELLDATSVQTRAGDRDRPPRVGLRLGRKGEGGPLVDLESERELQTGADALVLPDPLAAIALLGAAGARPGDLLTVLMTNRQRLLEVPVVFLGADGSQAPAAEPDAGREQEKMERIVTELLHPLPAGTRAIGACGPWFVALGEGGRILRAASFGMGDGWGAGLVFEPRR